MIGAHQPACFLFTIASSLPFHLIVASLATYTPYSCCLVPPLYFSHLCAPPISKEWRSEGASPQVFNLGRTEPVALRSFVATLERSLGTAAIIIDGGPSKGKVDSTAADGTLSLEVLGFNPQTSLDLGLKKFAEWYRSSERKPEFAKVASR